MNGLPALQRARNYQVVCTKQNGSELAFQAYTDETEAQLVAARLLEIGCPARVRRVRSRRESDGGVQT